MCENKNQSEDIIKRQEDFKKRVKEQNRWENYLEGIHYRACIISACVSKGEDEEYTIVKVLHKIPKKIRDETIENVAFIVANCSFIHETPGTKAIIVLNFEGDTIAQRHTKVAHEIAHYWLMRNNQYGFSGYVGDGKEKAADDLCESWGFGRAYKSYDPLER